MNFLANDSYTSDFGMMSTRTFHGDLVDLPCGHMQINIFTHLLGWLRTLCRSGIDSTCFICFITAGKISRPPVHADGLRDQSCTMENLLTMLTHAMHQQCGRVLLQPSCSLCLIFVFTRARSAGAQGGGPRDGRPSVPVNPLFKLPSLPPPLACFY